MYPRYTVRCPQQCHSSDLHRGRLHTGLGQGHHLAAAVEGANFLSRNASQIADVAVSSSPSARLSA